MEQKAQKRTEKLDVGGGKESKAVECWRLKVEVGGTFLVRDTTADG